MDSYNRKIIKILDTIPKFETYSQYSTSLEKVFQDNSFKNLLKHLREQRKPKIYSYFNVEEKKAETKNIFQTYGIENKTEESTYNLLNDDKDYNKDNKTHNEKEDISIKKENWKIPIINPKRRYNPQLDPFRYSPNYNSIYKNTPSVRIAKPFNETIPIKNKRYISKNVNLISIKNKDIGQSPFLTEIETNKNYDINSFEHKLLNNIKKHKKLNIKSEENDRSNHSIRFDKYVDRKILKTEINPNVSYLNQYDYQKARNNSIDFSKMHGRDDDMFGKDDNKKGPSIGYYNPNYDYLNGNMRNISLGNETRKEKDKKYLLKKIWCSYRVRVDYQLVDNKKLSKTILKDF